MTDEHRELLQSYINESFARFKEIVKEGRPRFRENSAALDQLATGEIFSAAKARENGVIDEIGFIEDAIDRAIQLAGLNKDEVRVVEFKRPISLFDLGGFAATPAGRSGANDLSAFLDLATPRAYYLATTWPPLISSYARLLQAQ